MKRIKFMACKDCVYYKEKMKKSTKCSCYHEEYGKKVCWGTREKDECNCNGFTKYCDFYPEKRQIK